MVLRGNKYGYYANRGFESHVCGIPTRSKAKSVTRLTLILMVVFVGLAPFASKAADVDSAFAIKFKYSFGEPAQKSQLRMGFFLEERDHIELEGLGLLEVRLTPARGVHYAVLDQETKQGPLSWAKTHYTNLKGKLRLGEWKEIFQGF